jgi:hypothetical protein
MRPLVLLAIVGFSAAAADSEFKAIVSAISDEYHTQPLRIPFLKMANVVTFVARPAGAKHFDLAVFQNLGARTRGGRDLPQLIERRVGPGWKPFLRTTSHHETTIIYMRPEGRDCRLLLTTIQPDQATVIQLQLNPDGISRWMNSPLESVRHQSRGERIGREEPDWEP